MANQTNNIMESVVDAQKQVVDSILENTKKLTNGNPVIAENVQKGSEWYKNWLETQKNAFAQTTEKATNTAETVKENTGKMNEFYQNWFNNQMNNAKQMWEVSQDWMKNAAQKTTADAANPTAYWNNMMSNWTNNMQNMQNMNTWMNNMQNMQNMNPFKFDAANAANMNPFNMDAWKKGTETFTGFFTQFSEMLNNNFADLQKNMQNGTTQDAYRNMVNMGDSFAKFYEMWTPMFKSIQDKTFNMDMYKQMANPAAYKELMDKYFGFMPEQSRQYMQQMTTMMQDAMKQSTAFGSNGYHQMRDMMGNMMPGFSGNEMYQNMLKSYNDMYAQIQAGISPIVRMMPENKHTKTMMEWNDIANRMMVYNIKNSEMQYMIYNQGAKVMDQLAENMIAKMENGQEPKSVMAMYQEWLNLSDKVYVNLFESDEYSQLMAEVSALQLKLKKDVEAQVEKMMVGLPVATRSEMDEMYKTIYDLKKQVRQLEKMLEVDGEVEAPAAEPAKTAAKGKKA